MTPFWHQVVQSVGQFLIVFFSGMAVFKGWSEITKMGIGDAIYQPFVQGVLSSLSIWGLSKIPKRNGEAP